ncbi:hypothetical protein GOQ27_08340 [Clostridium sp. D2Q-11]|uniref:Uncharacterized protein n=1 Tax=Anaeromonas frigoriresistens TaxID=2683708 RepID=A0A942UY52_9FIRM|nr:hypothetical protein [Anaeromonas frigoriresistens]MBS4538471.1 hypothetical protein [Anaeromonas frigoriresistens]
MEIIFEIIFEVIIEGIFAGIYYVFNKFLKDRVSEGTAKVISGILTGLLIVGAFIIIIMILKKVK